MSVISGIKPIDAYWYRTNYSQTLLTLLALGSNSNNLDLKGFRYNSNHSDSLDINDVWVEYSINSYAPPIDGVDFPLPIVFKVGIDPTRHGGISNDYTIEELVVYYDTETENGELTIEKYGGTSEWADNYSPVTFSESFRNFKVMIRTTDGEIIDEYNNRGLLLDTVKSANHMLNDGSFLTSIPYDADNGVYYYTLPIVNDSFCCIRSYWFNESQSTSIRCSHKIYSNKTSAYNYLKYGIDEDLEDENGDSEETTDTVLYYYDTMELYNDLGMTDIVDTYHRQIIVRGEDLPINLERTLVTYRVNANGSVDFVVANGAGEYLSNVKIGLAEYDKNDTTLSHNLAYYVMGYNGCGFGMYYDSESGYYVKNTVKTNMRGTGANGELITPESVGIGEGDEMLGNSNTADYDVGLSECWLLTPESMKTLASQFNTTVDKTQDNAQTYITAQWYLGLASYANPLDIICDLFYLPVDISDFCDSSTSYFSFTPTANGATGDGN